MRRIVLSRALWRPNFIRDLLKRIDVPAIRFIHSKRNSTNQNLDMFKSGIVEELSKESIPGKEEEQRYFQDLLQDSIRYEKLHKSLIECNPSKAIEEGMKRAFGENLITIWDENEVFFETGLEAYLKWELENILAFKSKIKQ